MHELFTARDVCANTTRVDLFITLRDTRAHERNRTRNRHCWWPICACIEVGNFPFSGGELEVAQTRTSRALRGNRKRHQWQGHPLRPAPRRVREARKSSLRPVPAPTVAGLFVSNARPDAMR